ncbi:hypothetical protein G7Y89_g7702 [Cudoniella acicularis]|uniref:Uncharacterized protein n=1 Tax=Cudoniella acicularis TaxID=354080 RepID=A0A8H4RHY3_9HELO|nr:hypothetical protein G7Y89_g7702 [Cudoniella acicularis]
MAITEYIQEIHSSPSRTLTNPMLISPSIEVSAIRSFSDSMAYLNGAGPTANGVQAPPSSKNEISKILPNTLYLTFNAPQHRGLFLTYPPLLCVPEPSTSGTLFHATYVESRWILEKRAIKDVSTSKTLVLLYRIQTIDGNTNNLSEQYLKFQEVLEKVPMGKAAREAESGQVSKEGNPALGGYDCVIWTGDALTALSREGLIDLRGRSVDEVMAEARSLAGPEDARSMVGKDFGGLMIM